MQPIPPEILADLFRILKAYVQVVVLNACWSEQQAQAIAQYIPHVIGMRRPIEDKAARAFAAGFYGAYGQGFSVSDAFELGRTEMGGSYSSEYDTPQLISMAESGLAEIEAVNLDVLVGDYLEQTLDNIAQDMRDQYVEQTGQLAHLQSSDSPKPVSALKKAADPIERIRAKKAALDAVLNAGRVELDAHYRASDAQQAEPVPDVRQKLRAIMRGVLLGEPGSGKTFTLVRLFIDYADAWLEAAPNERTALPIPVFVPLREYRGQDQAEKTLTFAEFVERRLGVLTPHSDQLLKNGRLVLLCDALNEMPRGTDDQNVTALREYLSRQPRFIVSCRVRDYNGQDLTALKPLEQVELQELDLPRIHDLILKRLPELGPALWKKMGGSTELEQFWHYVVTQNLTTKFWQSTTRWVKKISQRDNQNAWRVMHKGARLILLCRNPYMAYSLCEIYKERQGTLPTSRAALFGNFVEILLLREEDNGENTGEPWKPDTIGRIKSALLSVARILQAAHGTALPQAFIEQTLWQEGFADAEWLVNITISASILMRDGENDTATLRFTHQLLQEYFAAHVMLKVLEADEAAYLATRHQSNVLLTTRKTRRWVAYFLSSSKL